LILLLVRGAFVGINNEAERPHDKFEHSYTLQHLR
jgi:hypothetical protein